MEREREREIGVERNLILFKVSSQVCLTNSYVGIKVGFFRVKGCSELKMGMIMMVKYKYYNLTCDGQILNSRFFCLCIE